MPSPLLRHRSMRVRIHIALAVLWLLVSPGRAMAQSAGAGSQAPGAAEAASQPGGASAHDRWDDVRVLPPGSGLRVLDEHGGVVSGTLLAVTGDAVDVQASSGRTHITRSSIVRVEQVTRRAGRSALRGFLIGAAAGAALGVAATESNRAAWGLAMGLGWGGIGAAIGAARGAAHEERTLVYERAPAPRP